MMTDEGKSSLAERIAKLKAETEAKRNEETEEKPKKKPAAKKKAAAKKQPPKKKTSLTCWNCGSDELERLDPYLLRCTACRAAMNDLEAIRKAKRNRKPKKK